MSIEPEPKAARPPKWSLGVLNDKETDEVPGRCCAAIPIDLPPGASANCSLPPADVS